MTSIYGILNLGNTCYINVNIQMILNCCNLNNILVEKEVETKELLYSYICILKRLKEIRKQEHIEMKEESDKVYIRKLKLSSFIEKFRNIFSQVAFNQQDCLEGLTFILTNFHQTLCKINKEENPNFILDNIRYNKDIKNVCIEHFKNDIKKDHSLFFNLFYSYYLSQIKCQKCNHSVNRPEQYKEISLTLSKNNVENNLEKLLDIYFEGEKLEGYKCDNCKEEECTKSVTLLNTPQYLLIQLKRFEFNPKTFNMAKLMKEVNYPLFLDMNKYCLQDNENKNIGTKNIYNLTNIINHLGNSLQSGHYTSFHKIQNQWFYADDSDIQRVDEDFLFTSRNKKCSYVLIYEKQDFNE